MNMILSVLEFYRSSEDIAQDYEYLSDNDKEKVANINAVSSFDFEDEFQNYVCYFLISPSEIEKYKNVLDSNLISYICTDISKNVINNNINLEKKLVKYTNHYNNELYLEFIEKTNDWIKQNIDLDIILDMINEKGINSLRTIDKEFLEKI